MQLDKHLKINQMTKQIVFNLLLIMLGFLVGACENSKTEEETRGRMRHITKLSYGRVGDGQGWYFDDHNLYVEGNDWKPKDIDWDDIGDCEPSTNPKVEAFRCYSFAHSKSVIYLSSMQGDKPVFVKVIDEPYIDSRGNNLGEWVGDGRWLLFRQKMVNVETLEEKPLNGLPDYPYKYFCDISPELQVVVYLDTFYDSYFNTKDSTLSKQYSKQWDLDIERIKKGIHAFRLIDVTSGKASVITFDEAQYAWLKSTLYPNKGRWLAEIKKRLRWQKNNAGQWTIGF